MNDFLTTMQSFCEKLLQEQQAANIDQRSLQELSLKEIEDLKQHYLDEMLSLSNDLGIKDYWNEKIDIRFRRECEDLIHKLKGKFNGMSIEINKRRERQYLEQVANLSTISSQRFNSFYYDDDDDYDYNENEFIKSSVEDLVLIPSKTEDTSGSDSECILPSCDDFSPIDVPKENAVTFSNPLFNSNDDFISSDDESPSDEDISEDNGGDDDEINVLDCKDSYYDLEGDILYLDSFLNDDLVHHDPFIHALSVASILEGFTDESPLEENDELFNLEPKNYD
nr:hypothetical protein [Tanacetum cinerariifolium]